MIGEPAESRRLVVGISGASGVAFGANLGLTAFFHEIAGLRPEIAFALTLVLVLVLNFAQMRWFVWGDTDQPIARQFLLFASSSLGFRGLEYLAFLLLNSVLGVQYLIAVTGVLVVSFLSKFIYYRRLVFRKGGAPGMAPEPSETGRDGARE